MHPALSLGDWAGRDPGERVSQPLPSRRSEPERFAAQQKETKSRPQGVVCGYCGKQATLSSGQYLWPNIPEIAHKLFWRCHECDAHVGCHRSGVWVEQPDGKFVTSDGSLPFGTLANAELRLARNRAHAMFDPLWQTGVFKKRSDAYRWLAQRMRLPRALCHIAMFDLSQCEQAVMLATICKASPRS
jgi:hypothetical protein